MAAHERLRDWRHEKKIVALEVEPGLENTLQSTMRLLDEYINAAET